MPIVDFRVQCIEPILWQKTNPLRTRVDISKFLIFGLQFRLQLICVFQIPTKNIGSCLVDWLRIGSKSLYAMKIVIQKVRICPNAKFGRSFAASPLI